MEEEKSSRRRVSDFDREIIKQFPFLEAVMEKLKTKQAEKDANKKEQK